MKKLLKSALSLVLALSCFAFVGCDLFKEKAEEPKKVATIEESIAIYRQCDNELSEIWQGIYEDEDYQYKIAEAIAAATQVKSTDKSTMNIEYSNYLNFDINQTLIPGDSTPVLDLYAPAVGSVFSRFDDLGRFFLMDYVELNNVYKVSTTYSKVTNDNTKVQISFRFGGSDTSFDNCTIYYDSNSQWTAVERKVFSESGLSYTYVKRATHESRIFDQCIQVYKDGTTINAMEINEVTQKMIYVDDFTISGTMDTLDAKVYDYVNSLNIPSITTIIDIESAIEAE